MGYYTFICKRHFYTIVRFSSCASCVFYYYHFVWKPLWKLASMYLRKLIIPLS